MFCLIISFIIENIVKKNYKQVPTNNKHLTFILTKQTNKN